MEISSILIYGLAIWRISSLITRENGPFGVFRRFRGLVGVLHDADGNVVGTREGFFSELFSCIWCCSVWVSGFVILVRFLWPVITFYACLVLALSTLAIVADRFVRQD